jgi:hypothetical protein
MAEGQAVIYGRPPHWPQPARKTVKTVGGVLRPVLEPVPPPPTLYLLGVQRPWWVDAALDWEVLLTQEKPLRETELGPPQPKLERYRDSIFWDINRYLPGRCIWYGYMVVGWPWNHDWYMTRICVPVYCRPSNYTEGNIPRQHIVNVLDAHRVQFQCATVESLDWYYHVVIEWPRP